MDSKPFQETDELGDRRVGGELVFCLLLLAAMAVLVIDCYTLGKNARLVPLFVGVPTLVGLLVQFLIIMGTLVSGWRANREVSNDLWSRVKREALSPRFKLTFWTVSMVGAADVVGLKWAIPVGLLVFLRVLNRDDWRSSVLMTLACCGGLYLLFGVALGVKF